MRTLYHLWLSPSCRAIRLILAEKKLNFELEVEPVWERRLDFLTLNPAGDVPVLVDLNGVVIVGYWPICEYIDETVAQTPLLGNSPSERGEVRRLAAWFDRKFDQEVSANLVGEKVMKRLLGFGNPDSMAIRAGHANIRHHLEYISFLVERRQWLAGAFLSLADLTAAAHLSCVDYLGDVPWDTHQGAKDWYARIKSRPCFRPLLADLVPGLKPPPAYADLDF